MIRGKYLSSIAFAGYLSLGFTQSVGANQVPALQVSDLQAKLNSIVRFTVAPTDPDGVVPGVHLSSGPSDATLKDNGDGTRTFRWKASRIGVTVLQFTVTDARDSALEKKVKARITVTADGESADQADSGVQNAAEQDKPDDLHNGVPEFGRKYSEPLTNAYVTRVSGADNLGNYGWNASHQYSKRRAWNSDESLLEVKNSIVDANDYHSVVAEIPMSTERVWSRTDPNKMYGLEYQGNSVNRLVSYRVGANNRQLIHSFQGYSQCSIGEWEGDVSEDDHYILITCRKQSGGDMTAFSFDLWDKKIVGTLTVGSDLNWGGFSRTGQYILMEFNQPGSSNKRIVRYNAKLQDEMTLTSTIAHGDFGRDVDGEDVYVMIKSTGIFYYRLADGSRVNVGSDSNGLGKGTGHVSCQSSIRVGWCFFSVHHDGSMGQVKIEIDHSLPESQDSSGRTTYQGIKQFELWTRSRSTASSYSAQSRASFSPSGDKAIFASDWLGKSDIYSYVVERAGR